MQNGLNYSPLLKNGFNSSPLLQNGFLHSHVRCPLTFSPIDTYYTYLMCVRFINGTTGVFFHELRLVASFFSINHSIQRNLDFVSTLFWFNSLYIYFISKTSVTILIICRSFSCLYFSFKISVTFAIIHRDYPCLLNI